MSDDKGNRGPADRTRINVDEDYELAYWTKKLGVDADTLRAAVKAVGVSATAVEQHFQSKK